MSTNNLLLMKTDPRMLKAFRGLGGWIQKARQLITEQVECNTWTDVLSKALYDDDFFEKVFFISCITNLTVEIGQTSDHELI